MLALPIWRLPWCLKKYHKHRPTIRPLSAGEMVLVSRVFGDMVDVSQVRIVKYPYVPWQGKDVFIAPSGWIFVPDRHYQDDYSSTCYERVFIHEMTHVFQYQQGVWVLGCGAWLQGLHYLSGCRYDPYAYCFEPSKPFWDYNIEQQGRICEEIYLGNIPNIITTRLTKRHAHPQDPTQE